MISVSKKPCKIAVKSRKNTLSINNRSKRDLECFNYTDINAATTSDAITITRRQNTSR
jgi:hypothetical protein